LAIFHCKHLHLSTASVSVPSSHSRGSFARYHSYGCDRIGSPAHRQLAYEAALQSLVLLKNSAPLVSTGAATADGTAPAASLPLAPASLKRVALIGPFATNARWMYNRYSKVPGNSLLTSLAEVLQRDLPAGVDLRIAAGCTDVNSTTACASIDAGAVAAAVQGAEVVIVAVGTGELVESEVVGCGGAVVNEMGAPLLPLLHSLRGSPCASDLLPGAQAQLIWAARNQTGATVVVVQFSTSPKTGRTLQAPSRNWITDWTDALLSCYYPQNGGAQAIADVLLGRESPGGKMATSWPTAAQVAARGGQAGGTGVFPPLPARLLGSNVTYRFSAFPPSPESSALWPFAYGLSYARFAYDTLTVQDGSGLGGSCNNVTVGAGLTNTGTMTASETVFVFVEWTWPQGLPYDCPACVPVAAVAPTPRIQLVAFDKVRLAPGQRVQVSATGVLRAQPSSESGWVAAAGRPVQVWTLIVPPRNAPMQAIWSSLVEHNQGKAASVSRSVVA